MNIMRKESEERFRKNENSTYLLISDERIKSKKAKGD